MTNDTKNVPDNGNSTAIPDEKMKELVNAVQHNGLVALRMRFDEVDGQVMMHEVYGPIFVFRTKDESGDSYACGFFLRELIAKFQGGGDPSEWLASFFYELMKVKGGRLLPHPPQTEDEAKAIIDKALVPACIAAVKEEFAPEEVHAGLDWHDEHGPVFETGFPAISDGNNVCAFPLHVLMAHYLLNREPSELLIQGLYRIREEHGMN
ncbi:hypothetical protein [Cohnella yongneupensis]|uniref:Uncharacterized protein n=1 Tax=Cohnella yongneupensis TaxID=425006 RepID=A0ABW0R501_9BACL